MDFKEGKCPKCNGVLQVPQDRDSIICMYCGETLQVSDILGGEDKDVVSKPHAKPEDYEKYLERAINDFPKFLTSMENPLFAFKKEHYEPYFRSLCEENEDMLNEVWQTIYYASDEGETLQKIASEFVNQAASNINAVAKKGAREQKLMDYNLSLAVYIIPVILEYKDRSLEELADKILEEWKNKFPKTNVGKSDFNSINSGFRKKLCYITTAVCETLGKEDDCYELVLLRQYRDHFLLKQEDGEEVISEYYNIAPTIVKRINKMSNSGEIYKSVWENYLNPCIKLIEEDKNLECKEVYYKMVRDLQKEYCH
ncbi:CFI-box-CTERM domain-containing protein [Konateibacter massiliensis]|uniref:CFI-box-CTERM domain-containing protein n=1 Tax=Konateibacter massiliensis TaxID=2002841 RepID=UPI000C14CB6A|nr:CFI-box-CTERM domain-containing protein [Konateibacter massiliensis]